MFCCTELVRHNILPSTINITFFQIPIISYNPGTLLTTLFCLQVGIVEVFQPDARNICLCH